LNSERSSLIEVGSEKQVLSSTKFPALAFLVNTFFFIADCL
jgi:hypothetical protein